MKMIKNILLGICLMIGIVGCSRPEVKINTLNSTAESVMTAIQKEMADKSGLVFLNGTIVDETTGKPLYKLMDMTSEKEVEFFPSAKHFQMENIKSGYILEPLDSTGSSELIIVIEMYNNKSSDEVYHALQKVLSDQEVYWTDHLANEHQVLKDNIIEAQGNFYLYVTSRNRSKIIEAFQIEVS